MRVGRSAAFKRELGVLVVCHNLFSKAPEESGKQEAGNAGPGPWSFVSILRAGAGFPQGESDGISACFALG
jgi:hypothetical protein